MTRPNTPRTDQDYDTIFVGGAPRSGTTLLSAWLSASASCNPFAPEFHAIFFVVLAYAQTVATLDTARPFLLDGRASLDRQYAEMVRRMTDEAWEALGRPRYLALKQCPVTQYMPELLDLAPACRCLMIFRDPRDVVASRLEADRRNVNGRKPDREAAPEAYARQYARLYASLLDLPEDDPRRQRVVLVAYEDLVTQATAGLAERLGIAPVSPELLWRRAVFDIERLAAHHLYSEGWGNPVTETHVGRHQAVLSNFERELVEQLAGDTWRRLSAWNAEQTSAPARRAELRHA